MKFRSVSLQTGQQFSLIVTLRWLAFDLSAIAWNSLGEPSR